jgi:hypothetical protein
MEGPKEKKNMNSKMTTVAHGYCTCSASFLVPFSLLTVDLPWLPLFIPSIPPFHHPALLHSPSQLLRESTKGDAK